MPAVVEAMDDHIGRLRRQGARVRLVGPRSAVDLVGRWRIKSHPSTDYRLPTTD